MSRCDYEGHAECGGGLFTDGKTTRCHCHIVLQSVWSDVPPYCDLVDWLDELGPKDARIMYETMRESVGLWYWKSLT